MNLPDRLIQEFVAITNDSGSNDNSNVMLYGTLKGEGENKQVLLDGAETPTPAVMLMDGDVNDRVACYISNHTLFVTGNLSSPSMSGSQTVSAIQNGNSVAFEYMKANYASIKALNAITATINEIEAKNVTTDNLEAKVAEIGYVKTDEIDAKLATFGYMKSDFANVEKADVGKLLADIGFITSATISDGHVTGYLDSVEINANRITAGTLAVEQLLVKDESGKYKLLSVDSEGNTSYATIDGSAITENTITANHLVAKSVTANKLDVETLSSISANLGTVTAGVIQSENYVKDTSGMKLTLADGVWDSKNFKVDSEGNITSTGGTIGGFKIGNWQLYLDDTSIGGSSYSAMMSAIGGFRTHMRDDSLVYHEGELAPGSLYILDYQSSFKIKNGAIDIVNYPINTDSNITLGSSTSGGKVLTCYGTINANTLKQGGTNISSLFAAASHNHSGVYAAASHSHSYLPLSGGTLTGALTMNNDKYIKGKNTSGSVFNLIGINNHDNVHLGSYGLTHNVYIHGNAYQIDFSGAFLRPNVDNKLALGSGSKRWTAVYAKNGAIQTSDRNRKKDIAPITDVYEQLFDSIKPVSYMFNDGDRTHIGAIAQDIEESMTALGLTSLDFGGLCRDQVMEYDYDEEGGEIEGTERPVLDENGQPKYEYSLRYSEFIMLAIDQIQKLKKRVEELEAKLANS